MKHEGHEEQSEVTGETCAAEHAGAASREQMDVLMDKGRDLVDSAAELIRERPLASFGVAFAAGWIIAKLARSQAPISISGTETCRNCSETLISTRPTIGSRTPSIAFVVDETLPTGRYDRLTRGDYCQPHCGVCLSSCPDSATYSRPPSGENANPRGSAPTANSKPCP